MMPLFLALALVVQSPSLGTISLPMVMVRYEPHLANLAKEVVEEFPLAEKESEEKIGPSFRLDPVVVLLLSSPEFQKMAENSMTVAFAVPMRSLIVIDSAKMKSDMELNATLKHEFVHLFLGHGSHPNFPKWFDEGVAQWASGGFVDLLNAGSEDVLRRAVLYKTLIGIDQLTGNFPRDAERLALAYQEGKSLVRYIAEQYGDETLRKIIDDVKSGKEFNEALRDNLLIELSALEQGWRRSLRNRYLWPAFLAENIYFILFLLASLTTFAGYLRFRKRLRTYRDDDDEEEGTE